MKPFTRCPSLCLLASLALSECTADQRVETELATAGLSEPRALSDTLKELGLDYVEDVRRLNGPEQLELAESLKAAGVNLGSRSKLRQLAAGFGVMIDDHAAALRQVQEDTPASSKSDGSGFSVETLAIGVTGLLGVVSYVLQAKLEVRWLSVSLRPHSV